MDLSPSVSYFVSTRTDIFWFLLLIKRVCYAGTRDYTGRQVFAQ